jgi:splicing factor 3B subunit 2
VDESGNPLYGDVFGQYGDGGDSDEEVVKGMRWGALEPEVEESEEEEEEEEAEEEGGEEGERFGGAVRNLWCK